MKEKKLSGDDTLDETNFKEFAHQAIKKYFEKSRLVDGFLWREIIRHYEAEIEKLKSDKGGELAYEKDLCQRETPKSRRKEER